MNNQPMRKARHLLASAVILTAAAASATAQQAPVASPVEDASALVKRMEERLRSLDKAARERDQALGYLSKQVEAAQGAIDGGGQTEAALRQGAAALSTRLDEAAQDRERLSGESASDSRAIEDLHGQLAAAGDREKALAAEVTHKERMLGDLQQKLAALESSLGAERGGRADAQGRVAALQGQLDAGTRREQALIQSMAERDRLVSELQGRLAALAGSLDKEKSAGAEAQRQVAVLRQRVEAGDLRERELAQGIANKETALADLARQVAALGQALGMERQEHQAVAASLAATRQQAEAVTAREQELGRQVADLGQAVAAERDGREKAAADLAAAQQQTEAAAAREQELGRQVADLGQEVGAERDGREKALANLAAARQQVEAAAAREKEIEGRAGEQERAAAGLRQEALTKAADLARLADEVAGLRQELERTQSLLGGERAVSAQRQTEIASLSGQLKAALESQIQELSQYRSEFFGRLRQVLGDRGDVRIVGDRFVFQAEVLFGSGSASLGEDGQEQLRRFARTLQEVAATIPPDVSWILRVDGHTDRVPIGNAAFASNWQLSSARAIAVVEFLVRQGIPPDRLAAAGFGEFQPLETTDDEIAYRRNRRIEFKLTER
ncbi:MAG TPA: peptidoglycan -binding protein [Geminicoccaceae bacterium]|nr:peptidoglycan -binding protein [Geminicoccus sp.]HMU52645.1 peptidoglycan -binding protein [Geminicoccaceae bacterium]